MAKKKKKPVDRFVKGKPDAPSVRNYGAKMAKMAAKGR